MKRNRGKSRTGKTRDFFKKIRDTKGIFHAKMGTIKDRNGMDLKETEDLKKKFLGFPCGSAGKDLPAMQETWVRSLGWEDPLEKGKATHSSILACRIPWTDHRVTKSRTQLSDFHSLYTKMVLMTWIMIMV